MFLRRAAARLRNLRKKDDYVEKYELANGLSADSSGGFARLVKNYKAAPMVMDRPKLEHADGSIFYNHLGPTRRIFVFL